MVDTRLAKQQGDQESSPSPDKPVGVPTDIANQITRWIPTETITIYVALLALLAPISKHASYESRWVLLGIVTAANPLVVLLLMKAKTQQGESIGFPWFEMLAASVAFVAWAFALPDTPLSSITAYQLKWNAAILLITTTAIVLVANALHKSPDYDQVMTMQQGAKSERVINTDPPGPATGRSVNAGTAAAAR
jgi:hypothetical protein